MIESGESAKLQDARNLNLIIVFIVVGWGAYFMYILDQKWQNEYRFLYRAFTCWWLSWLAWAATWLVIPLFESHPLAAIITFLLSDLNAVFLVLVYFYLTRGNEFQIKDALHRASSILLALGLGFWALHSYIPDPDLAKELQESLELCIGVVATMLLGWAFALRFNSTVVLMIGYIYGLLQPIAYMALFHEDKFARSPDPFITAIMVLAFLKIAWATVVTWYFMQEPESTENLVKQSKRRSHFQLFQSRTGVLELQTVVLIGAYVLFLSIRMQAFLDTVTGLITKLVVIFGILVSLKNLWSRFTSKPNGQDSEQKKEQAE